MLKRLKLIASLILKVISFFLFGWNVKQSLYLFCSQCLFKGAKVPWKLRFQLRVIIIFVYYLT
jgi:hypothetical protein